MMIVNLLIWALLGAWMLQITLAVGIAIYLVTRALTQRESVIPHVPATGNA